MNNFSSPVPAPSTERLYTLSQFLHACIHEGLAVGSKPTYLKYEHQGVFRPGRYSVVYDSRIERMFTDQEVQRNISEYKRWKSDSLQPKK